MAPVVKMVKMAVNNKSALFILLNFH